MNLRRDAGLVALGAWIVLAIGEFAVTAQLNDLRWYFAAAQRLNDGHALYSLSPGDLFVPVAGQGGQYATVLPYPPLIAVLWRPLEALGDPLGIAVWMAALGFAMGAAFLVLFRRSPLVAAAVAPGLGYLWGSGNAIGWLFPLLVAGWYYRDRWWLAALFGVMAAVKVYPLVWLFVLVADRNWRACGWLAAGLAGGLLIGIVGAGLPATLDYPHVAATMGADRWSEVVLVAGSLVTMVLPGRWAYRAAILTLTLQAPFALAGTSLVGCLGLTFGRVRVPQLRTVPSLRRRQTGAA